MKIVLIRHGATAGNIKKRYIGITDEDLHILPVPLGNNLP
jgi:broad specificity phosphatase PhoE